MKICIITYTENGKALSGKIEKSLKDYESFWVEKDEKIGELWDKTDAFIFVCAAGIAVRKIAPFIKDKLSDPAVLVIDELGMNVIPILSGHVGGANELAKTIETKLGIRAVITTATDINGVVAVDEWAVKNGLTINDKSKIKKPAMKILKGDKVDIAFSKDIIVSSNEEDAKDCDLWLFAKPKIVAGIGCRRGKEFEKLESFLLETFKESGQDISTLCAIASIDLKTDEEGLIKLSEKYDVPFITYSSLELSNVEGEFETSSFVEEKVGVSDVSARAAKLCGGAGEFILKKKKEDGMTISLFKQYKKVTFWYEED